jgi:hypothetical protein
VQLTVIRDRKENVVTMTAGKAKTKGAVSWPTAAPELMFRSVTSEMKRFGSEAANEISSLAGELPGLRGHNFQ